MRESVPPPEPADGAATGAGDPIERGVAGRSARQEHARRAAQRETRVREQHPKLALLALSGPPTHEAVWAQGAAGEERLAARLQERLDPSVVVLHDRRIPGSRANIDHIAIAPGGVWVVNAKTHKRGGKVQVRSPLLGKPKLLVGGRDQTSTIDGLERETTAVRDALATFEPTVRVIGALCFLDAELPLTHRLTIRGFALLRTRQLAKDLGKPGPLTPERIQAVARGLAERFPVA